MKESTVKKPESPMVAAEIELIDQIDRLAKSHCENVSKHLQAQIDQLKECDTVTDEGFAEHVRDLLSQKWIDVSLVEKEGAFALCKLQKWRIAEETPFPREARSSILIALYETYLAILRRTTNKSVEDSMLTDRSVRMRFVKSVLHDF